MSDISAVPDHDRDAFAAMLDESSTGGVHEGNVIEGIVVAIERDLAVVDVGLKTEGRISLKEFTDPGQEDHQVNVGDRVEVYLERVENAMGEAVLSRDKAKREEAWERLEEAFNNQVSTQGLIHGRVKGGFTVDLSGVGAFLPGSQIDIRPIRDAAHLMGSPQEFQILKMDRRRGNIVVSRRAVLEEARAEQRNELVQNLHEGQVIDGLVKNITDYGAFIDLGGLDGLLHVTDMAWRRVHRPGEVLTVGETVTVQVIKINQDTQRISLGMKQLQADPWDGVEAKYILDAKFTGQVTNITDYGAFVELEPGIEGLVHVSEMSWIKKNVHPGKVVSTSQEVEVMILEVDLVKRRISLGLKQCLDNPWDAFAAAHPPGDQVEGEIRNITEFGLFVGLDGGIDGMVHISDLDWNNSGEKALEGYSKKQVVRVEVLDVDIKKERISLGIKQLAGEPLDALGDVKKNSVVTCTITGVRDGGIDVTLGDGRVRAFIRRGDLARERSAQRPEAFAIGDKVDASVTQIDRKTQRVSLSIKVLEIAEEKEAMKQYGSSDSGASLGDILGAVFGKARAKITGDSGDAESGKSDAASDSAPDSPEESGADKDGK